MIRKHIDNGLIVLGCMLMVASFLIFSTSKRDGQNFRNIVAQIKFLKNTVQTKMAGSVAWFTGEEEEKINAYGLGLTSAGSSARYLYLDKIQIISLDDSLIEFLPDDELKLSKGSAMVLNPDGKIKMADKDGNTKVVQEGMLYTSTDKGITSTPTRFEKAWVSEGDSYSVELKDNILTEYFLLAPPTLAIARFGDTCIGRLEPIGGDAGDVSYEVMAGTKSLQLTNMEVTLPTTKSDIAVRSLAKGGSSVWREVQLPAYCIKEGGEESALPIENLAFFSVTRQQVLIAENATHNVMVDFDVAQDANLEIKGPDLDKSAMIKGKFRREYRLSPGTYSFKLKQVGRTLNRTIIVKIKPFKIKDAIFIEEQN